jgi:hypothetical protein
MTTACMNSLLCCIPGKKKEIVGAKCIIFCDMTPCSSILMSTYTRLHGVTFKNCLLHSHCHQNLKSDNSGHLAHISTPFFVFINILNALTCSCSTCLTIISLIYRDMVFFHWLYSPLEPWLLLSVS